MRRLKSIDNRLQQIEEEAAAWEQTRISGANSFLHDLALVYGDGSQPATVSTIGQVRNLDRLINAAIRDVYGHD